MSKYHERVLVRIILASIVYYASFRIVLLQINSFAFKYVDGGYLYIAIAEHFAISFLYGYFWVKISNIKGRNAVGSVLILPTIYLAINLSNHILGNDSDDAYYILISFIAVGQYAGALFGSIVFQATKAKR